MNAFRNARFLWCAAAVLCAPTAMAQDGKALFATCTACHGAHGAGNPTIGAPALAGQDAKYLERQLANFRSGLRGASPKDSFGEQMRAAAAVLGDAAAVTSVSAYASRLPAKPLKPAAGADLRNGNNLYHGKCGACHGGRAEGNVSLGAPRLSGLDADYLKRQVEHFKTGLRGSDPKDRYGRQMRVMASSLATPKDLDDVIAFIHAQGAAPAPATPVK
jgi:cytochrome c oxidase subunit 2